MKKNWKEKLNSILKDKKSGSSIIAERIEELLSIVPKREIKSVAKELLYTHSSMGAVINRINMLCLKEEGEKVPEIEDSSQQTFLKFWNENFSKKRWITISMSRWVTELLKKGENLEIIVGVSYPQKEGIITADTLANLHYVELVEDCALIGEVEDADGIIVGADLITNEFIINKIGTYSLALAANYFHKPFYVISSGDKYLTSELSMFFKIKTFRRGMRKINIFESIPRRLITEIYLVSPPYTYKTSKCLKELLKEID